TLRQATNLALVLLIAFGAASLWMLRIRQRDSNVRERAEERGKQEELAESTAMLKFSLELNAELIKGGSNSVDERATTPDGKWVIAGDLLYEMSKARELVGVALPLGTDAAAMRAAPSSLFRAQQSTYVRIAWERRLQDPDGDVCARAYSLDETNEILWVLATIGANEERGIPLVQVDEPDTHGSGDASSSDDRARLVPALFRVDVSQVYANESRPKGVELRRTRAARLDISDWGLLATAWNDLTEGRPAYDLDLIVSSAERSLLVFLAPLAGNPNEVETTVLGYDTDRAETVANFTLRGTPFLISREVSPGAKHVAMRLFELDLTPGASRLFRETWAIEILTTRGERVFSERFSEFIRDLVFATDEDLFALGDEKLVRYRHDSVTGDWKRMPDLPLDASTERRKFV